MYVRRAHVLENIRTPLVQNVRAYIVVKME